MTREQIELEMTDLTNRFWVELTMQNFDQVDLIQKRMKTLEALMRIEEDEEEVEYCPYGDCKTDSWEIPDKREFLADLEVGTPHIQRHDTHFQIESWEQEL